MNYLHLEVPIKTLEYAIFLFAQQSAFTDRMKIPRLLLVADVPKKWFGKQILQRIPIDTDLYSIARK